MMVKSFVPDGEAIIFPAGTEMTQDNGTWAMYINHSLGMSWVGYRTPRGTRIVPLGGIRAAGIDQSRIDAFIKQRQATGCQDCG